VVPRGEPTLADADRPAQDQILMGIDPGTLGELLEQCAVEAARGAVIDILDGGLIAQPGTLRRPPMSGIRLLSGVIRTWSRHRRMTEFDPTRHEHRSPEQQCSEEFTVKRETLAGSLSLSISMCGRARTDRNITDKSKERARGTGQIPVLAIEHVNWNGCLQM